MSEESRGRLALVTLAVLWLLPVCLVAVLWRLPAYLESSATSTPAATTQTTGSRSTEFRSEAVVRVTPRGSGNLVSQASGVITSINSTLVEGPLAEGQRVIAVDGVWSLAQSGRPFFRGLRLGDRGSDVAELTSYLRRIGIDAPRTRVFTASVAASVKDLQRRVGVRRPDGSFQVSYVVFFANPSTLTRFQVQLASTTAAGASVATVKIGTPEIRFTSPDATSSLPDFGGRPVRIEFGDKALDVDDLDLSISQRTQLAAQLAASAAQGDIQSTPVDEAGSVTFTGVGVRLVTPESFAAVPVSAILTDPSGDTCVFTGSKEDWTPTLLGDMPASTEIGIANAPVSLVGKTLLLNPAEARPDLACK